MNRRDLFKAGAALVLTFRDRLRSLAGFHTADLKEPTHYLGGGPFVRLVCEGGPDLEAPVPAGGRQVDHAEGEVTQTVTFRAVPAGRTIVRCELHCSPDEVWPLPMGTNGPVTANGSDINLSWILS